MSDNHIIIKKLLNLLIKRGKKGQALKILLNLLKVLGKRNINGISGEEIIIQAILNLKPQVYWEKYRKKRKLFFFPKLISYEKKINLALSWIIKSIKLRKERKMEDRLSAEFLDCFSNKGLSMLEKHSLYKTLTLNKPFFHLIKYK